MQQIGDTPHHATWGKKRRERHIQNSRWNPTTWTLPQSSTWKAPTHATFKGFLSKFSCPHGTPWQSPRSHSSPDDSPPHQVKLTYIKPQLARADSVSDAFVNSVQPSAQNFTVVSVDWYCSLFKEIEERRHQLADRSYTKSCVDLVCVAMAATSMVMMGSAAKQLGLGGSLLKINPKVNSGRGVGTSMLPAGCRVVRCDATSGGPGGLREAVDRATKKTITKDEILRNQETNESEKKSVFGTEPTSGSLYPRAEVERRPETGDLAFTSVFAFDGAAPETINCRLVSNSNALLPPSSQMLLTEMMVLTSHQYVSGIWYLTKNEIAAHRSSEICCLLVHVSLFYELQGVPMW